MRISVKNGYENLSGESFRGACGLNARLRPDQISQMCRGRNFNASNLPERKPDVFSLEEDFHHKVDRIIGVPEILEWLAVQSSIQDRILFGGAVERVSRLGKVAGCDLT